MGYWGITAGDDDTKPYPSSHNEECEEGTMVNGRLCFEDVGKAHGFNWVHAIVQLHSSATKGDSLPCMLAGWRWLRIENSDRCTKWYTVNAKAHATATLELAASLRPHADTATIGKACAWMCNGTGFRQVGKVP